MIGVIVMLVILINSIAVIIIIKRKNLKVEGITIDNNSHFIIPFVVSFKMLSDYDISKC